MVSSSGSQLLPEAAIGALRTLLIPLATLVTPNIPEAKLLLNDAGIEVRDPVDVRGMIELGNQLLHHLEPKAVLLKGGHLPLTQEGRIAQNGRDASVVVDVLLDGEKVTLIETNFLLSRNTHGTGCSLASAISARLALGQGLMRAVRGGVRYVETGIKTSAGLGKGNGPINHFHSVYSLPFAPYVFCLVQ